MVTSTTVQNSGYKAATTKLDKAGTLILLERGFLCRSAYNDGGATANVSAVERGDVLHCYFSHKGKYDAMGAFMVGDKAAAPKVAKYLGDVVPGTALYAVSDPSFIRAIDPAGAYEVDPTIGVFTGWAVRRVGRARSYLASAFPGQSTLVRLP